KRSSTALKPAMSTWSRRSRPMPAARCARRIARQSCATPRRGSNASSSAPTARSAPSLKTIWTDMGMDGFEAALRRSAEEVEQALDGLLPKPVGAEARVLEAMRYAIFGGGKRLRPFLALASAAAFGVDRRSALRVAGAI